MSKASSEIYHWLEQQGAQGSHDSQGHFTLKHSEAWAKLSAYQFPIMEGWVLKLVQAVTVSPQARLKVQQFAQHTVFSVTGVENWTRELIEEAVFQLDLSSHTAISHLGMALRFLVQIKDRPFTVGYTDGEDVIWTGQNFAEFSSKSKEGFHLKVGHYTFAERKKIMSLSATGAWVSANIAAALRQHCHLTDKPISIDNFWIVLGRNDVDFGTPALARPLAILQVCEDCDLPSFDLANTIRAPKVKLAGQILSLDTDLIPELRGNNRCHVAGILSFFLKKNEGKEFTERSSKILWVNDGVIVHRETLSIPLNIFGLGLIVCSKGLLTDISGLIPRPTPEYERRKKLAIQEMSRHLASVYSRIGVEGINIRASSAQPLIMAGVGLAFAFTVPVLSVPFFAASLYRIGSRPSNTSSIQKTMYEALADLVDQLGKLAHKLEEE